VIAALLLARPGAPVVLLEMHATFDREFRGDTMHPSMEEIPDQTPPLDVRKREPAVRKMRPQQAKLQKRAVSEALAGSGRPFRIPLPNRVIFKLPFLRLAPAAVIGLGFDRERVEDPGRGSASVG
jgi:hypothetical protein